MAQTVHPLDDEIVDFSILKRKAIRLLGRDGEYDAEDRAFLSGLDHIHDGVSEYRFREVAADAFKRNGPTRHTVDRFKEAKCKIVILEDERNAREILQFPRMDGNEIG